MLQFGEPMPSKFNEGRRHKFPRARYRVTNWPDYDAALVRRGELTVWLTEEAIASWYARRLESVAVNRSIRNCHRYRTYALPGVPPTAASD
jgi:hypothetical protein